MNISSIEGISGENEFINTVLLAAASIGRRASAERSVKSTVDDESLSLSDCLDETTNGSIACIS